MKNKRLPIMACAALWLSLAALSSGCDTANNPTDMTVVARDLAMTGGGDDMAQKAGAADMAQLPPDMGCYGSPMTHYEIINACTTSQKIDKHPRLPLLTDGGGLPPLP